MRPFLSPKAIFIPSGDQLSTMIQFYPCTSLYGVCVSISHSLTVVSPDPVANIVESGENADEMTESVCPMRLADDLVMGATL